MFPYCNIIIMDNKSTDNSVKIAKKYGCQVVSWSDGIKDEQNEFNIAYVRNNCYKNCDSGWIIVCDMDEWLLIDENTLLEEHNKGVTVLNTKGFEMIGNSLTNDLSDIDLFKIEEAVYNKMMSKKICFNKTKIHSMNYDLGSHGCKPDGIITYSEDIYTLKHMNMLGEKYFMNKMLKRYERTESMREKKLDTHYTNNIEEIKHRVKNNIIPFSSNEKIKIIPDIKYNKNIPSYKNIKKYSIRNAQYFNGKLIFNLIKSYKTHLEEWDDEKLQYYNIDIVNLEYEKKINISNLTKFELYNTIGNNILFFSSNNKNYFIGGIYNNDFEKYSTKFKYKKGIYFNEFNDLSNLNESFENSKLILTKNDSLSQNFHVYFDSQLSYFYDDNKHYFTTRFNEITGVRKIQLFSTDDFLNFNVTKLENDINLYQGDITKIDNIFYLVSLTTESNHSGFQIKDQAVLNKIYNNFDYILFESTDGINYKINRNISKLGQYGAYITNSFTRNEDGRFSADFIKLDYFDKSLFEIKKLYF